MASESVWALTVICNKGRTKERKYLRKKERKKKERKGRKENKGKKRRARWDKGKQKQTKKELKKRESIQINFIDNHVRDIILFPMTISLTCSPNYRFHYCNLVTTEFTPSITTSGDITYSCCDRSAIISDCVLNPAAGTQSDLAECGPGPQVSLHPAGWRGDCRRAEWVPRQEREANIS